MFKIASNPIMGSQLSVPKPNKALSDGGKRVRPTDEPPIDVDKLITSLPSPTWEEFKQRWSTKCNSPSNRCRFNPVRGFPCSYHIWLEDKQRFCIYEGRVYWRIKLKRKLEGIKPPSNKRGRKSSSPISFTV